MKNPNSKSLFCIALTIGLSLTSQAFASRRTLVCEAALLSVRKLNLWADQRKENLVEAQNLLSDFREEVLGISDAEGKIQGGFSVHSGRPTTLLFKRKVARQIRGIEIDALSGRGFDIQGVPQGDVSRRSLQKRSWELGLGTG